MYLFSFNSIIIIPTFIIKERELPKVELTLKNLSLEKGAALSTNVSAYIVEELSEEVRNNIIINLKDVNTAQPGEYQYTVTYDNALSKFSPEVISFVASNDIGRSEEKQEDNNYYVYAGGELIMRTTNVISAINVASEEYGVVIDGKGDYVWARLSKLDNLVVPSATDAASPHYGSISEVLQNENIEVLDVSTVSIQDVLYYSTKQMPVLVNLPEWGVVAISGYSGYLGNVDTIYFRAYDGENFNMPISEAENQIIRGGHRYIVVMNR